MSAFAEQARNTAFEARPTRPPQPPSEPLMLSGPGPSDPANEQRAKELSKAWPIRPPSVQRPRTSPSIEQS